jgi:hypothetical protein
MIKRQQKFPFVGILSIGYQVYPIYINDPKNTGVSNHSSILSLDLCPSFE